jgi:hypothetical protein
MRLFEAMNWKSALLFLLLLGVPASGQVSNQPDFTHLTITMKAEGGPCGIVCPLNEYLSCCPAYSVSLDENGTVLYNGVAGVKVRGEKVNSISIAAVRALVAEFLRIGFYSLQDRYTEKKLPNGEIHSIDHANATTISLDIDGKKKSIYIFYGAPDELIALQRKLYDVTQIAQYVGRP